ncbi:hypothetical protein HK097_007492 [Rhizophlyctis rosea]|uniref:Uncharacterized protein n=1 Tax=Rhizophlyctis rosea TaxID=64517 RepID=A0AAD5X5U2_9FUNG|nr:hypothetical protein HK097_007492 [Rhizophlyctis rosea]
MTLEGSSNVEFPEDVENQHRRLRFGMQVASSVEQTLEARKDLGGKVLASDGIEETTEEQDRAMRATEATWRKNAKNGIIQDVREANLGEEDGTYIDDFRQMLVGMARSGRFGGQGCDLLL